MGVELNSTLNQFVNWASQTGIGKDDLVHAKTTQGATGAILEETLAQVERWRQNLNGMREAESTLDSQVAEERAAFGSGAFIQV